MKKIIAFENRTGKKVFYTSAGRQHNTNLNVTQHVIRFDKLEESPPCEADGTEDKENKEIVR